MSKLIAIRIDEWLAARKRAEAERRDREGYERRPTKADEFSPVLGAQVWPGERRK